MSANSFVKALAVVLALAMLTGCRQPRPAEVKPSAAPAKPSVDARPAQGQGLETWTWTIADLQRVPTLPPAREASPFNEPPGDTSRESGNEQAKEPAKEAVKEAVPELPPEDDLATLLEPFADTPNPFDAADRARLESAGLTIAVVPRDQIAAIEARLRLVGVVERQQLGEAPLWTELARTTLRIATSLPPLSTPLEPGTLQLATRAWLLPVVRASTDTAGQTHAAMQLWVGLIHRTPPRPTMMTLSEATPLPIDPQPLGTEARRPLSATAILDGSIAVLLMPTQPPRSAGELLLNIPESDAAPRLRRVIVLIPHVPARFELIPTPPSPASRRPR